MGVLGLWKLLDSAGHPIKIDGLEGKRLGVDANIWLYKFIRGFREKDNATSIESHKLGLFNRICKLLFYKIKPVFVFDGPAPVLKRRTLERRQDTRNKSLKKMQTTAAKLLAEHLKEQYPELDLKEVAIRMPEFKSNNLAAAEKFTNEDRDLFQLPPPTKREPESSSEDEFELVNDYVDVNSDDFKRMPPEMRYELLQEQKQNIKKIRRSEALPEDASDFSNLQLQRLKARRSIQESIEQCEREICGSYTGEMTYRIQSDPNKFMLYTKQQKEEPKSEPKSELKSEPKSEPTSVARSNSESKLIFQPKVLRRPEPKIVRHSDGRVPGISELPQQPEPNLSLSPESSPSPEMVQQPSPEKQPVVIVSEPDLVQSEPEPDLVESKPELMIESIPPLETTEVTSRIVEEIQLDSGSDSDSDSHPDPVPDHVSDSDSDSEYESKTVMHHHPLNQEGTEEPVESMVRSISPTNKVTVKIVEEIQLDSESDSEPLIVTKKPVEPELEPELEPMVRSIPPRETNKVTAKIVEEAKELLRLFGIPYIDASGEAEAQCALLEEMKLTEGTITDDSDIWLFGAKNVYRNFFSDDKWAMQYKMPDIEFHIRMNRENLVCFAMLVGSDYTDGLTNVGPVTALEILSEFQGDGLTPLVKYKEFVQEFRQLPESEKDKNTAGDTKKRKRLLKFELPEEFPSRSVFDGYMNPIADNSREEFTWGLPDMNALREYARRNFGWDPKKVDEKLLPVIARATAKERWNRWSKTKTLR